jgi:hypothetical protein
MTLSDARAAPDSGDYPGTTPTPGADGPVESTRHPTFSPHAGITIRAASVRRPILWVVLVVAVTLVATGALVASRGNDSGATAGFGGNSEARAGVAFHGPAEAADGSSHHRRIPIRRNSPTAS